MSPKTILACLGIICAVASMVVSTPLLLTVGLTVALVGVTTNIFLVIAGAILAVVVIIAWIRDTRRDIDELPLDHH